MAIEVSVVGFDIAKNIFQVHGVDRRGAAVLRRRLRRAQVPEFFRQLTGCLIGMEATRGAHYWARVLRGFGHDVRLIAPQFVKPFLKSQKNDANDAEAICEAVSRPNMRFVPSKSIEQQDLQALHRVRSRLIGCRTQLGNQIRGLLAEYGIVLPLHLSQVRKALPQLIEEENSLLSGMGRQLLAGLYEELCALERRIVAMEEQIHRIHHSNALCQKIAAVEGVGPVIATAVVAAIADGRAFHNGRQFAAWVGLVPRQHSSGEKQRLMGITKRGDPYLRMLLIHGARSVVYRAASNRTAEAAGSARSNKDWEQRKPASLWQTRTHASSGPCWLAMNHISELRK